MSGGATPFESPGGMDPAGPDPVAAASDEARGGPLAVVITGEDWLDAICPFLRARDGSWRSASPAREHRCWATEPRSELPVLTQQRLCLVRSHDGCERFLHARELRSASLARERVASVDTPPVGLRARGVPARRATSTGDTVRGIMADVLRLPRVALGAIAVGGVAVALVLAMVVSGWIGGTSSPTPTDAAILRSLDPGSAEGTPGPDGMRRYRVREGDTLRTIADRFGVSVRQLRQANDLGDPPRLTPGEVILVPPGG